MKHKRYCIILSLSYRLDHVILDDCVTHKVVFNVNNICKIILIWFHHWEHTKETLQSQLTKCIWLVHQKNFHLIYLSDWQKLSGVCYSVTVWYGLMSLKPNCFTKWKLLSSIFLFCFPSCSRIKFRIFIKMKWKAFPT